jgi:hypothetical protein
LVFRPQLNNLHLPSHQSISLRSYPRYFRISDILLAYSTSVTQDANTFAIVFTLSLFQGLFYDHKRPLLPSVLRQVSVCNFFKELTLYPTFRKKFRKTFIFLFYFFYLSHLTLTQSGLCITTLTSLSYSRVGKFVAGEGFEPPTSRL